VARRIGRGDQIKPRRREDFSRVVFELLQLLLRLLAVNLLGRAKISAFQVKVIAGKAGNR
jgi:hypothetical protein